MGLHFAYAGFPPGAANLQRSYLLAEGVLLTATKGGGWSRASGQRVVVIVPTALPIR